MRAVDIASGSIMPSDALSWYSSQSSTARRKPPASSMLYSGLSASRCRLTKLSARRRACGNAAATLGAAKEREMGTFVMGLDVSGVYETSRRGGKSPIGVKFYRRGRRWRLTIISSKGAINSSPVAASCGALSYDVVSAPVA